MAEGELEARRAEIGAQLEALRMAPEVADLVRQADSAVQGFKAETAALEEQLAELDRQVGARERHRRAETERERQDQRSAQRRQLVDMAEERRQAIAEAEAGARQLADALGRTLVVSAQMARLTYELTGQAAPMALNEFDLTSRLSSRLGAIMVGIPRCRARFGGISWPASSRFPSTDDWAVAEEKLVAAAIQPALERSE